MDEFCYDCGSDLGVDSQRVQGPLYGVPSEPGSILAMPYSLCGRCFAAQGYPAIPGAGEEMDMHGYWDEWEEEDVDAAYDVAEQ